ncbi:MAG: ribosome maturation factor RimP [Francisellaceae bacterium]
MLIEQLKTLLQPEIERLGYILWGIETEGGAQSLTLRIFIDHEDGISVDDCQATSEAVSAILDVEDPISSQYVLEISSPGMNRRVFNAAQAESLIGFEVKVQLVNIIDNRRKFKGVIDSVSEGKITVTMEEGQTICFDFADVDKMRVVPRF